MNDSMLPSSGTVLAFPPQHVAVAIFQGKGRGLVATVEIAAGTRLFSDPVIVVDGAQQIERLGQTGLDHWLLHWRDGAVCVSCGWTMLINHTRRVDKRNVTAERDEALRMIHVVATRDIRAGEELLFDYELSDEDLRAYGIPLDA